MPPSLSWAHPVKSTVIILSHTAQIVIIKHSTIAVDTYYIIYCIRTAGLPIFIHTGNHWLIRRAPLFCTVSIWSRSLRGRGLRWVQTCQVHAETPSVGGYKGTDSLKNTCPGVRCNGACSGRPLIEVVAWWIIIIIAKQRRVQRIRSAIVLRNVVVNTENCIMYMKLLLLELGIFQLSIMRFVRKPYNIFFFFMIIRVVYGRTARTLQSVILYNTTMIVIRRFKPEQALCRTSSCLISRLCLKWTIFGYFKYNQNSGRYFTKISNNAMLQFWKCNKFEFINNVRRSLWDRIFLKGTCSCEQNLCYFVHPTLTFRLVCSLYLIFCRKLAVCLIHIHSPLQHNTV